MSFEEGEPRDIQPERDQSGLGETDPVDSGYNVDGVTADECCTTDLDDDSEDPVVVDGEKSDDGIPAPGDGSDDELIEIDWSKIGEIPRLQMPEVKLTDDPEITKLAADALARIRESLPVSDFDPFRQQDPALSDELQGAVDQYAGEDARDPDDPTRSFMDFRQPFDGMQPPVPPDQQKAAGALLSSYLGERVPAEQIIGRSDNYATDDGPMHVSMDNGGLNRMMEGEEPAPTDEPRVEGSLAIARWIGRGHDPGEGAVYQLGSDGVVRRYDRTQPTLESEMAEGAFIQELRGPEDRENWTEEDKARHLDHVMEVVDNDDANDRMATNLGLNRQPVGPAEVARAIRYAEQLIKNPRHFDEPDDLERLADELGDDWLD